MNSRFRGGTKRKLDNQFNRGRGRGSPRTKRGRLNRQNDSLDPMEYIEEPLSLYQGRTTAELDDNHYSRGRGRGRSWSKRGRQNRRNDSPAPMEESYEEEPLSVRYLEPTTAALDMQIEILKKHRIILEEERKILEEKQRLEKFKMQARMGGLVDTDEALEPGPNSTRKRSSATKVILRQMVAIVTARSDLENQTLLKTRLRVTIQKRLTDIIARRPKLSTYNTIKLYREMYPESEDERFVLEHLEHLYDHNWVYGEELSAVVEKDVATGSQAKGTKKTQKKAKVTDTEPNERSDDETQFRPKLLCYYQASKIMLKTMNPAIVEIVPAEKRNAVFMLLRYLLKDRFTTALGGRPIFRTNKVLKIYREMYAPEQDAEFIREALKDVEENGWTGDDVKKVFGPAKQKAAAAGKSESPDIDLTEMLVEKLEEDESKFPEIDLRENSVEKVEEESPKIKEEMIDTEKPEGSVEKVQEAESLNIEEVSDRTDKAETSVEKEIEVKAESLNTEEATDITNEAETSVKNEVEVTTEIPNIEKATDKTDKAETSVNKEIEDTTEIPNIGKATDETDKAETSVNKEIEVETGIPNIEEATDKTDKAETSVNKEIEDAAEISNSIDTLITTVKIDNTDSNDESKEENVVANEIKENNDTVNATENQNEESEATEPGANGTDQVIHKGVKRKCNSDDDEATVAKSTNWIDDNELEDWD